MRAEIDRVAAVLCAGRAPRAVIARLTIAAGMTGALWATACLFLAMEPTA